MDLLVSIVIPVYNVDHTLLNNCISSLINQTYKNLEIIIVDDGSKDNTGEYCDKLTESDERVRVIHQKNQGVSAARNNGTNAANGDYILYVDGDDVLCPIAVSEGVNHIKNDSVDMVISCVQKIRTHSEFSYSEEFGVNSEIIRGAEIDQLRKHYIALNNSQYKNVKGTGYINRGPYCRLIRKDIALSNPFTVGLPIGEDVLWNMSLLNKCESVCIVYNIWYGYLIHGQSAIRKYYGDREVIARKYLNQLLRENNAFFDSNMDEYVKNVAMELYCLLNYELLSPKCEMNHKQKKRTVKGLFSKEPWSFLKNKQYFRKLPIAQKVILLSCNTGTWIMLLKIKNMLLKR